MTGSDIPMPEKLPNTPICSRFIYSFKIFQRKLLCFLGIHDWKLQSGLPGTPKYWCGECKKISKELW